MTINKDKLKNLGLWFSLASVLYLILEVFGIDIAPEQYENIVNVIATILTTLGLFSNPNQGKFYIDR